jgi:hypothetical protein
VRAQPFDATVFAIEVITINGSFEQNGFFD